ncbi:hypothetical protein P7C70_g176, partial [Phenoliferia sp. Uapishka_3]
MVQKWVPCPSQHAEPISACRARLDRTSHVSALVTSFSHFGFFPSTSPTRTPQPSLTHTFNFDSTHDPSPHMSTIEGIYGRPHADYVASASQGAVNGFAPPGTGDAYARQREEDLFGSFTSHQTDDESNIEPALRSSSAVNPSTNSTRFASPSVPSTNNSHHRPLQPPHSPRTSASRYQQARKGTKKLTDEVKKLASEIKLKHALEWEDFAITHGVSLPRLDQYNYGVAALQRKANLFNFFNRSDLCRKLLTEKGYSGQMLISDPDHPDEKRSVLLDQEEEDLFSKVSVQRRPTKAECDAARTQFRKNLQQLFDLYSRRFGIEAYAFVTSDDPSSKIRSEDFVASSGGSSFVTMALTTEENRAVGALIHGKLRDFKGFVSGREITSRYEEENTKKSSTSFALAECLTLPLTWPLSYAEVRTSNANTVVNMRSSAREKLLNILNDALKRRDGEDHVPRSQAITRSSDLEKLQVTFDWSPHADFTLPELTDISNMTAEPLKRLHATLDAGYIKMVAGHDGLGAAKRKRSHKRKDKKRSTLGATGAAKRRRLDIVVPREGTENVRPRADLSEDSLDDNSDEDDENEDEDGDAEY